MKLSNIIDAVIGFISLLCHATYFAILYTFTRTRCCICDDKILRGELKYRVREPMGPGTIGFRSKYPVCTMCANKVREPSTAEVIEAGFPVESQEPCDVQWNELFASLENNVVQLPQVIDEIVCLKR